MKKAMPAVQLDLHTSTIFDRYILARSLPSEDPARILHVFGPTALDRACERELVAPFVLSTAVVEHWAPRTRSKFDPSARVAALPPIQGAWKALHLAVVAAVVFLLGVVTYGVASYDRTPGELAPVPGAPGRAAPGSYGPEIPLYALALGGHPWYNG